MTFNPSFPAPFNKSFTKVAGGAWWNLFGQIPNANVVAAYQAKGAASLAASYTNLANPGTYNLTDSGVTGWNAIDGWIFTGTTYLDTGYVPVRQVTCVIVRFSDMTVANRAVCGSYTAAGAAYVLIPDNGAQVSYTSGNTLNVVPGITQGNLCIAGDLGYRNGVQDPGSIGAGAGVIIPTLFIGGRNHGGGVWQLRFTGYVQAFALYTALTAPQVAALYTAMNAL